MDGGPSRPDPGRVRKRGAEGLGTLLRFWFGPKTFERSGELYERLGVRGFKRFLPFGYHANRLVRALGARGFRVVKDERSAMAWVLFTMVAEALHTLAFAAFSAFMVLDLLVGEYGEAAVNLLLNLSVNAYPVMAQRYTRIRLLKAFRLDLGDAGRWEI